ncbi:hypothetical protein F4810DRAFT_667295 [Camillea tinctor]|nr:hypothetical protein F4810DRAFT_667295 [Camillea tinctor]
MQLGKSLSILFALALGSAHGARLPLSGTAESLAARMEQIEEAATGVVEKRDDLAGHAELAARAIDWSDIEHDDDKATYIALMWLCKLQWAEDHPNWPNKTPRQKFPMQNTPEYKTALDTCLANVKTAMGPDKGAELTEWYQIRARTVSRFPPRDAWKVAEPRYKEIQRRLREQQDRIDLSSSDEEAAAQQTGQAWGLPDDWDKAWEDAVKEFNKDPDWFQNDDFVEGL